MTTSPPWRLLNEPVRIPVPGNKLIEELSGRASTGIERFSLAHMVAPPGWEEPPQTPSFGELTIMIRGCMSVEAGDDTVIIGAGEAFWVEPGITVRYSNPHEDEAEYYAVCMPAFTVEGAGREPT